MERVVVTLETAKKLKDAGFPQRAVAKWALRGREWMLIWPNEEWPGIQQTLAAVSAQEIADKLPRCYPYRYTDFVNKLSVKLLSPEISLWVAGYPENDDFTITYSGNGPTMAEALAALYLKLKETN